MYYETFDLVEPPFQLTPDQRYLYLSKMHRRAKAYMDYAVWNRDGFIVITGEIGAGKTTLINKLLTEIADELVIIRLFQTQLDDVEFLQAMMLELEFDENEVQNLGKVQLLHKLNLFLIDTYSNGKQVVLIVDEAQNLSVKVLEEIRMLAGLDIDKDKLINIILVGQPELNQILNQPNMTQLVQRIRLRFHVGPLKQDESIEYIYHRLRVAGSLKPEKVFTKETFPLIYKYTNGIPRRLNVLCDTAMVCAYADNKTIIDDVSINDAIDELKWDENYKDPESSGEMYSGIEDEGGDSHVNSGRLPSFKASDQHWGDIFTTLIQVIGDLTSRMRALDDKISSIEVEFREQNERAKSKKISNLNSSGNGERRKY